MCITNVLLSHRSHHLVAKAPWHRFEGHRGKQNTRGFPHVVWHQRCCRVQKGCVYACMGVYIYMLTPPLKPTVFNFLLCFTVIFVGFCRQKQPAFFSFIWRLWMLDHDESWCFMCRYNDIFWWYLQHFQLPYCVPNKGFQFKHWQNAHGTVAKCIFQALHWFLQCFYSFLWHMKFWILYAFRSSRHFFWWSIW